MSHADEDPEAASHCPNCGAEYRAGFTTCSDCGVDLVLGPAPKSEPPRKEKLDFYDEQDMRNFGRTFELFEQQEGKPVEIATEHEPDLGLLIGKLESEGIGARPGPMVMNPYPRAVIGAVGPMGAAIARGELWVVLVREPNAQRAKEIYERFADIQGEVRRESREQAMGDLAQATDEAGSDEQAEEVDQSPTDPDDAWAEANRRIWGTSESK